MTAGGRSREATVSTTPMSGMSQGVHLVVKAGEDPVVDGIPVWSGWRRR